MKFALCFLFAVACAFPAGASDASPIAKVLQMIGDLQTKVIGEGEAAQKEYAEFAEWCEDSARQVAHEIKTGKAEVDALKASIDDEAAVIASNTAKIEQLAADVSQDSADLKAASDLRAKENADFAVAEKELIETIDTITRAIAILEKEMKKSGGSLLQVQNAATLTQALTAMVQASAIATSDAAKLTAFVQQAQQAQDSDDEEPAAAGPPAAAAYEGKSGGIIDTLEDLSDKAENALAEARKKESTAAHNFNLLKASLDSQIEIANKEMDDAKKDIASATEKKSTAEGELQVATKELAADIEAQGALHHDCMTRAENFEAETKSRGEELAAIAEAKKIIIEATTPAAPSFLQLMSRSRAARRAAAKFEVVRFVRELAHKQHSALLAQLAMRLSAAVRTAGGEDPLAKVKSLITELITKLEEESDAEADKKAYCDHELATTGAKKTEKSERVASLTTKIDEATARIAQLAEEVAKLEAELAALVKSQAELDKLREQEKALFEKEQAEQDSALKGVRLALKVLSDYYAKKAGHQTNSGAASGIIGLLEVCESDISKELAELVSSEETAVAEYEQVTKENALEKATKEKDVEYKTKESKELSEASAQLTADRTGVQQELDAVLEYLRKVEEECVAKAEQYEERAKRRQAELDGLKEALTVLSGETALVQRAAVRRTLRNGHFRIAAA